MSFVFPILLGGLVLAGVPVLLHLIVRQKPKRLPFPAFRFLVQQHRSNTRKLRLRHLLLLALRVFLIGAMCLLLARPRLLHRVLGLDSERPMSAVLLFDTSASMEFHSSDGLTRLDDARQRGRELLDELPPGSRVAVLDSADIRPEQAAEWLSLTEARQRVASLKIRPGNAPVTQALLRALARFDQTETDQEGRSGPPQLRLLAVFSDRTRASWDAGQVPALVDKLDRIPLLYEGLLEARGRIGPLQDLLNELREKLPPPAGKDYNEQSLLEALVALRNDLSGLTPDTAAWPQGLAPSVKQVRRLSRELLAQLWPTGPAAAEPAQAFRGKLRSALSELLRATGGAVLLFVDVGMDAPVDLALAQVELPRTTAGLEQQLFAEGEPFTLQAVVRATGKDAPVKVVCQVGDRHEEFKGEAKAGERLVVPFAIGPTPLRLKAGDNSIEVRLDTGKEPSLNQRRYATVRVQPKRRVLVVVDEPRRAGLFARALRSLRCNVEVKRAQEVTPNMLAGQAAVYLLGVEAPAAKLWDLLAAYVKAGGGLGIVPAGQGLKLDAYRQDAARQVMPGTIVDKIDSPADLGSSWNWEPPAAKYGHSFMKRFKAWKDNPRTDFMVLPRGAFAYWDVTPRPGAALVLVEYAGKPTRPAVLERLFDAKAAVRGKVLLFTTPLDEQQTPAWNNYAEEVTSFYIALVAQATGYLAGEATAPQLNFTLGHGDPVVVLPPGPALNPLATLRGPDLFRPLTLDSAEAQLTLKDLAAPGNYLLEGKAKDSGEQRRLAAFSLNVPAEESDLTRVPAAEIEPLFAGDALLALGRQGSLHEALQAYRNEPLDLVPYFMLAILFALAVENLLANKFYRRAAGT